VRTRGVSNTCSWSCQSGETLFADKLQLAGVRQEPYSTGMEQESQAPLWDAFVSHAREDKAALVEPLVSELQARGYRIWYDRYELKLGDSLRESIERGLTQSRFGVVILSKSFFKKRWPRSELDGLLAREHGGRKVILPIWHEVSEEEVASRSPILAGRLAIESSEGISAICDALIDVLGPASSVRTEVAIARLPVEGNAADLEGLARNVLITGETASNQEVVENKLSEILDALSHADQKNDAAPEPVPANEPKAASRYDTFVARGHSGRKDDVDFLMSALYTDRGVATAKLVDFALSAVERSEGVQQIRFYLFNGELEQRNYAALYFKRAGNVKLLAEACAQGKIDRAQAFSR
jgi:hypothetical protein